MGYSWVMFILTIFKERTFSGAIASITCLLPSLIEVLPLKLS